MRVFVNHSPRTSMILRGLIKAEGIPADEIIEIRKRGTALGVPVRRSVDYRSLYIGNGKSRLLRRASAWKADRLITELACGKAFDAYIPGPLPHFNQLLISHPLCRSVNLIEEGVGSNSQEMLECRWLPLWVEQLLRRMPLVPFNLRRFYARTYMPEDFDRAFALVDETFSWMPPSRRSLVSPSPQRINRVMFNGPGVVLCPDSIPPTETWESVGSSLLRTLIDEENKSGAFAWVALSPHPDTDAASVMGMQELFGPWSVINLRQLGIEVESLIYLTHPLVVGCTSSVKQICEQWKCRWISYCRDDVSPGA